ncbi:hypothetical protein sos41_13500 [Alphaproteobacteria bacterium SO-S41]|nr:hypothetical protein sos41_13500 [Alphaproteobacteria bacterium SO-S41]
MTPREPYSYRADPDVPPFPDDRPLIVFDGMCVFCSRFAQLVLRRDRRRVFRMTTVQSPLGIALCRHYGLDPTDPVSSLLIENGRLYPKSAGGLRIFARLCFPWSLLAVGRVLPRAIADWLYDRVALNRIAWFGARETCLMPDPADAGRFLA